MVLLASTAPLRAQETVESEIGEREAPTSDARFVEDSTLLGRLDGLSRLWGYVKYFHPALAYRSDVDWDAALVATVPLVLEARDNHQYAKALDLMLKGLGDPETRIETDLSADPVAHLDPSAGYSLTDDEILVFRVGDYYKLTETDAQAVLVEALKVLSQARAVVLDLRSRSSIESFGEFQLRAYVGAMERGMMGQRLETPGERRRVYYGFPNSQAFSSGQYRAALLTRSGRAIVPTPNGRAIPSVVLVNRHSALPAGTVALQAAGRARIVFEGSSMQLPSSDSAIDLPESIRARVRTREPIFPDGTDGSLRPDTTIAPNADGSDPALDLAIELASKFEPSALNRRQLPAAALVARDPIYPEMAYPDLGYRFLALARLWNTIEYFYPYKHLLDTPWADIQSEFIPKFAGANTSLEYARVVAEMATRLHDSHSYVAGSVFNAELVGNGYPPIRVRVIENTPIVAGLRHREIAGEVEVGDVVIDVDGENPMSRLERYARLTSGSTLASRLDKASLQFLNGPVGSTARLTIRKSNGDEIVVTLVRKAEDFTTLYHRERSGDIVQVLKGNIGYVDLDRLELASVDQMFDQLARTDAIIFDMRGYPNGTAWRIAPWLAETESTVALFSTPMPGHESPEPAAEMFQQVVTPSLEERGQYEGRTVMLIDERTQSQAEHTGLYLRAANGTRFIGSHSAGANGEITSVTLPGRITVGFTGQSVRHPDGTELQRVGLIPDVEVTPTIRGIQKGRDEVLERALAYLRQPPSP